MTARPNSPLSPLRRLITTVKQLGDELNLADEIINPAKKQPKNNQYGLFQQQFILRQQAAARQQAVVAKQIQLQNDKKDSEEAHQRCLEVIQQHLQAFLQANPEATYPEWIADLHPENAKDGELDTRHLIPGNPWETAFEQATSNRAIPQQPGLPAKNHLCPVISA